MAKETKNSYGCIAVTDCKVSPFKIVLTDVLAMAEIVLNDQFIVRGIRVKKGEIGAYVSYPEVDYIMDNNFDKTVIAQPITRQLREHVEACILEKYREVADGGKDKD